MKEVQGLSEGLYEVRIKNDLAFQYTDYGFLNWWENVAQARIKAFNPSSYRPSVAGEELVFMELQGLVKQLERMTETERIASLNAIRAVLHDISPFKDEPVDYVAWVPQENVVANDYNPNSVAPPEMELLRVSIMNDGYTQPIVTMPEEGRFTVIDGFHRNRVGKECKDVSERLRGYLPVVKIRSTQEDRGDRIASTIRHNRARGKHRVEAMSDIVVELKRRNWSDEKIGKQLGMDPDEVLRLTQISGLAEMFADADFSEAWEPGTVEETELTNMDFEEPEE